MSGFVRSMGGVLLGTLAVPIAGMSGIAALISALMLIFSSSMRSFGLFVFLLIAASICYWAIKTLRGIDNNGRLLIAKINAQESLNLDPHNMLGYPSPAFLAFDKQSRKLAICNSVTGDYKLHPFESVMQWYYEWGTGTRMDIGITRGERIDGTAMRQPTLTHTEYNKNFTVVLELADEKSAQLKFVMRSEEIAKRWCAKLNAIFNG